jgi:hypothetical protein
MSTAAPRVECRDEDARGVPRQLQAAVSIEIVGWVADMVLLLVNALMNLMNREPE